MLGDCSTCPDGSLSEAAGVVPRAVAHMFDAVAAACAANASAEAEVVVTFLELYNEEITDLLCADEPDPRRLPPGAGSGRRRLDLQADAARGGVVVKGLEEFKVTTREETFELLKRCAPPRAARAHLSLTRIWL